MCVYVHIGLPKTATTSLQQSIFEEGDGKYWDYLGVRHPREKEQRVEYRKLLRMLSGKENHSQEDLFPRGDLPLLISEEMITVDGAVSWQDKLQTLSRVLTGRDVRLLLTVRRPEKAVFSLYVERYHSFRGDYPDFDSFLKQSNQAKIYDYKYLFEFVEKTFGEDKLTAVAFEGLKTGDYLKEVARWLGADASEFEIPHSNTKRSSGDSIRTHSPTLLQSLDPWIRGGGKYSLRGALRWALKGSGAHAIRVPWAAATLHYPDYELVALGFRESNRWFAQRTGIDYS